MLFFTSYACWVPHRQLYQTGILCCRFINEEKNENKSNLHFRFLYVRNASGLVKDKAKLLHMIILIFTLTYHFNRIGIWVVAQLATGLNYELIPLGKYCMMTNISLTWHGELDQDFPQRATSNRMQVMVSMALFSIALTYVCLGALVAR